MSTTTLPDPTVGYAPGEQRPLAACTALAGAFFASLAGALVAARASGREIERPAIGELLVCPYCVAQWVAGGLAVGHILAPRTTRFLSAMWAAQAIADGVQLAYSAGETRT